MSSEPTRYVRRDAPFLIWNGTEVDEDGLRLFYHNAIRNKPFVSDLRLPDELIPLADWEREHRDEVIRELIEKYEQPLEASHRKQAEINGIVANTLRAELSTPEASDER